MSKRKTVEVRYLVDKVNQMLIDSEDELIEGRRAVSVLIEHVLMLTGNYSGFRYLEPYRSGIDESRRHYHMKG